jgi:hypothetical protein
MGLSRLARSWIGPWAGLLAGMSGAGIQHQLLSDMLHFDCRRGGAMPGLLVGAAALALIATGAWVSWRCAKDAAPRAASGATRRFVAHMGLMGAALFALLVCWQSLSGLVLPACSP